MDHIFGDTDEIGFGTNSVSPAASLVSQSNQHSPVSRKASVHGVKPTINRISRESVKNQPIRSQSTISNDIATIDTTTTLSRLIAGMKPSFLPRDDDMTNVRVIALS